MEVVKIIRDEDGEKIDDPKWHYVHTTGHTSTTLCGGQVFGDGEGTAVYKTKTLRKGSITCRECINIIKEIKTIPL